jgi:uncharacterized protein
MKRNFIDELTKWKYTKKRKPLIIQGARQVGKTWVMKEFGKKEFKTVVYLNFESSQILRELFVTDFNIERIIATMEIESKKKITASNTLIILDEIQEAPRGLTALKYFHENAPEYYVISAGSLLGISIQRNHSFPVGKVDILHLYPLSFSEFLVSIGEEKLVELLEKKDWKTIALFHTRLVELTRLYYFVGGMPEAVADYIESKNLTRVRQIQQAILIGYENDFGKHAPAEIIPKMRLVWNALISQLAKENRKFIYGQIKQGGRAKEFEKAIQWLVDAGLVLKVNRIEKPTIPLRSYTDIDSFKLFFLDIGLLNAMAGVDQKILLEKNKILTEYKGAMTEQFICQQLNMNHELYYWVAPNATAEVDFVIQHENEIVPIEAKAEENLKSKSLKVFVEKFDNKHALRISMSEYREVEWLTNYPLYAVGSMI